MSKRSASTVISRTFIGLVRSRRGARRSRASRRAARPASVDARGFAIDGIVTVAVLIDAVAGDVDRAGVARGIEVIAIAAAEDRGRAVAIEIDDAAPHAHEVARLIAERGEQLAIGVAA